MTTGRSLATLTIIALLAGCIGGETDPGMKDEALDDGKFDQWDYRNNPSRFRIEFEYQLSELPQAGEAEQTPWADDYWSYYRDSINYRWRGNDTLSPAELYDVAFNDWEMPEGYMELQPQSGSRSDWDAEYYEQLGPLANDVHRRRGNLRATNGVDDDDDGEIDETNDHDGIESWWGVCHAWAPAAVMEPEPSSTVTYNGQEFTPSDIKALMMITYDSTRAIMLGGRCNTDETELTRGDDGRFDAGECQDVNAGAFHVVITNMLGRYNRAFDEDRTFDTEVWNQPIRSYRITDIEENLSAEQAMERIGQSGSDYVYNADAVNFAWVEMDVRYITESSPSEQPTLPIIDRYTRTDHYSYILELDADGNVIGGEWSEDSLDDHPDFLWLPTAHGTNFRTITYENVRMLVDMANNPGGGGTGEGDEFTATPNLSIPDNNATGVTSNLNVESAGTISSLTVDVNITHTYIGDLTVRLTHNGQDVTLHGRQGGGTDDLVQSFTVADFNGQDVSGQWTLFVSDQANIDTGTLNSWGLNVVLGEGGGGDDNTPTTYASTGSVEIPDNDSAGTDSVINVTDTGSIGSLRVEVNLTHTWIGDLIVELRHAGGVRVLHNRGGGSDDNINTTYDVDEFNGTSIQGAWTLHVVDNAGQDVGTIDSWSLNAVTQ